MLLPGRVRTPAWAGMPGARPHQAVSGLRRQPRDPEDFLRDVDFNLLAIEVRDFVEELRCSRLLARKLVPQRLDELSRSAALPQACAVRTRTARFRRRARAAHAPPGAISAFWPSIIDFTARRAIRRFGLSEPAAMPSSAFFSASVRIVATTRRRLHQREIVSGATRCPLLSSTPSLFQGEIVVAV